MSLMDDMRADVEAIMTNTEDGAAVELHFVSPMGIAADVSGFHTHVTEDTEFDDGSSVTNSVSYVTVPLREFEGDVPEAIVGAGMPWRLCIGKSDELFAVIKTKPDHTAGIVTCYLGDWSE